MQISATITFDSAAEAANFFSASTPVLGQALVGTAAPAPEETATPKADGGAKKAGKTASAKPTATEDKAAASSSSDETSSSSTETTAGAADAGDDFGFGDDDAPAAPTYESVKDALMAWSKKVDRDTFAALMKKAKVTKVPELEAKPAMWAPILAEIAKTA